MRIRVPTQTRPLKSRRRAKDGEEVKGEGVAGREGDWETFFSGPQQDKVR